MSDVTGSFVAVAGVVALVCIMAVCITGNLIPLIICGAVIWAIFCVACGLVGDDK